MPQEKDTAINLIRHLIVVCEPAGASGAFWKMAGPRRLSKEVAAADIATFRESIERYTTERDARVATLEAELTAEREAVRVLETLKETARRNGFLDAHGQMRKLLSASTGPTLYLTTDGCIVGNTSAFVWAFEIHPGCRFSGKVIAMKYETWFATRWDDDLPAHWTDKSPDGVWGCYSTQEAATDAAKAREG